MRNIMAGHGGFPENSEMGFYFEPPTFRLKASAVQPESGCVLLRYLSALMAHIQSYSEKALAPEAMCEIDTFILKFKLKIKTHILKYVII